MMAVYYLSFGNSKGRLGSVSVNKQEVGRELMSRIQVEQMSNTECLVFIRALRPFKVKNGFKVYDKERCICELIMDRRNVEVQNFQTAIKDYMLGKDKKLSRLVEYAERLGIRDEVMKYVEVLV